MKRKFLSLIALGMSSLLLMSTGCSVSTGSAPAASSQAPAESQKAEATEQASAVASQIADTNGDGKIVIGCDVYYMSEFVTLMVEGIKESVTSDSNIELKLLDANRDPAKQMSQVEGLISEKVDVLLVAPVHSSSSVPVLELAKNANIPIVILNTELDTTEPYYFAGPNDVQAGELLMEDLAKRINYKGNIVILEGPIGHSAQIQRYQGIQNVLAKYPDIKVLETKTANWNRDEAVSTIENWLQAHEKEGINAVAAENDEMALGAVQALESKGINDKVAVGGVDAIKDACLRIDEGKMESTVLQDAGKEGKLGVELALKLAKGETVPEYKNLIQMDLITKEDGSAKKLLDTIFK